MSLKKYSNKINTVRCECSVLLGGNNTLHARVATGDTRVVLIDYYSRLEYRVLCFWRKMVLGETIFGVKVEQNLAIFSLEYLGNGDVP